MVHFDVPSIACMNSVNKLLQNHRCVGGLTEPFEVPIKPENDFKLMLTTRSEIVPKKRFVQRRYLRPFPFPQTLFVRYTFLVLPLHLITGFILCYAVLFYFSRFYYSPSVQVYMFSLNERVNDIVPMLVAIAAMKILQPLRMRFLFYICQWVIRAKRKYLDSFIRKLQRYIQKRMAST